ncbi:Nucleic acid-binding protein [Gossypium australe]|uniref:Nucleic acid-binding protein n=1 Tax=Gossypium australe TaxID=47621 RepID=A0A5B6WMA8_9ROSI|nr:Nucleic acid-binding protein [Gossypium australe]
MAESKSLRKPVFTKVDQLRPGTIGHTLTVKVVNTKMVLQKGRADGPQVRQMRIAECLVGDETGMIIFTARNEQVLRDDALGVLVHSAAYILISTNAHLFILVVDLMKEGTTITLRNAKIDMFKGSMRLAVDKWGRVEVAEPANFNVKEDNNLSLIEYELVNVVEE